MAITTRADKDESPYMKPFVMAFEEDVSGDLSEEWNIIKIGTRKGEKMQTVLTNPCLNPLVLTLHGMHMLRTKAGPLPLQRLLEITLQRSLTSLWTALMK